MTYIGICPHDCGIYAAQQIEVEATSPSDAYDKITDQLIGGRYIRRIIRVADGAVVFPAPQAKETAA